MMITLAELELLSGRPSSALEPLARCHEEQICLAWNGLVEHALGHARRSQRALDALIERYAHVRAYEIGLVHAARGDLDRAFDWLERAAVQRESGADSVKIDPVLRPLRGDPRFSALFGRNLPLD